MSTDKKTWVKDLLVAFAATTLSIILTFGTTGVINRGKQKQERKLTALMVMGSIEQFARPHSIWNTLPTRQGRKGWEVPLDGAIFAIG